jgi:hypothetical protein
MMTTNNEQFPQSAEYKPKRLLGRLGARLAGTNTPNYSQEPRAERKFKIRGEKLIVSRGAQLRPVSHFLHVAEKARAERVRREGLSHIGHSELDSESSQQ